MSKSKDSKSRPGRGAARRWRGAWITGGIMRDLRPADGPPLAFRKDVSLPAAPTSARLRITASSRYLLYLNGRMVACGPCRSWPARQLFDELDVAEWMVKGLNHLAVVVCPPTGATGAGLVTRMGLLIDGQATCGRKRVAIFTDDSWQAREAHWYLTTGLLASMHTAAQEHLRGDIEPAGWRTDTKLDGWAGATALGPADWTPPWRRLEPRPIPLLVESPEAPLLVWRGKAGRKMADPARNLSILFNDQRIAGGAVEGGRGKTWFDAADSNVFTFDLGRTRLVRAGVDVKRAGGPVRVELYYDNALGERPRAMRGFGGPGEGFCDTFTPPRGNSSWQALAPRGCRFVTVKVTGAGSCRFRPRCRSVDYPYPEPLPLDCDDALLEKVWSISAQTLRSSTNEVIVDTCSRENLLWTFDACVSAKAAFYTFGETKMWRHCLSLIMQGIDEDGVPTTVPPAGRSFMILFDQNLYAVVSCLDYYMASADDSLLDEAAEPLRRLLSLCENHVTADDLFVPPPYSWHWVDWAPLDKRPYSLPINLLLLLAAEAAGRMAAAVRHAELKAVARRIARRLRPGITRFFDEARGCFRTRLPGESRPDGFNIFKQKRPLTHDLHSNALAVRAGAGSGQQRRRAMAFAAGLLARPACGANRFGPGWTELILAPLFAHGHGEVAMKVIAERYGQMLDAGAPTWAEGFGPHRYNTAHGWGSAVNTLIAENVVGLRPLRPGWKEFSFDPHAGALGQLAATAKTPLGDIRVALADGSFTVAIPRGATMRHKGRRYSGRREVKLPAT